MGRQHRTRKKRYKLKKYSGDLRLKVVTQSNPPPRLRRSKDLVETHLRLKKYQVAGKLCSRTGFHLQMEKGQTGWRLVTKKFQPYFHKIFRDLCQIVDLCDPKIIKRTGFALLWSTTDRRRIKGLSNASKVDSDWTCKTPNWEVRPQCSVRGQIYMRALGRYLRFGLVSGWSCVK